MPHVRKNYLLLKTCLRKKGFATAEEAWTTRHHVYQCPACGKWHRTSRKGFKEDREKKEEKFRESLKKRKKLKRRSVPHPDDDPVQTLVGVECLVLFSKTPRMPERWSWLLPSIKAARCPHKHVCMSRDKEAPQLVAEFLKEQEADGYDLYVLHGWGAKDPELRDWSNEVRKEVRLLMGWGEEGKDDLG